MTVSRSQQEQPIGVFDSGIGGLTVVRALSARLPHENIVYFGDTARVPYGPKSPQVVREYAAQDAAFLMGHHVKMVVVACNTVSAVALDVVQKLARVPVVGVIQPGAEAALRASVKRRIGIIGTQATVNSGAYAHAIRALAPDVQVDFGSVSAVRSACGRGLDRSSGDAVGRKGVSVPAHTRKDRHADPRLHALSRTGVCDRGSDRCRTSRSSIPGEAAAVEVERLLDEHGSEEYERPAAAPAVLCQRYSCEIHRSG